MNRQIIVTEDGSHSFFIPELNEQYHSVHGAIQESEHVFIKSGLLFTNLRNITIFEVGFGTGLNAFLALLCAEINGLNINYFTVEKYPLKPFEYEKLNYADLLDVAKNDVFKKLHTCNWNEKVKIDKGFSIYKIDTDFRNIDVEKLPFFDLVFFDAFAPDKQPDLWNLTVYSKLFKQCNIGSVFVTYCAKGVVRRELQQVGFRVERIPGPPGKKEMLRAIK